MEDSNSKAVGEKCELRIWQDRVRKDGSREIVRLDRLDVKELPDDDDYAIVVRHEFTDRNVLDKTTVEINSPYLLRAFRDVVRSHPAVASDFTKPFEMDSPFQMLFHFWDQLTAHRESVDDDKVRMHLSLLLDFMKKEMGRDREQYLSMMKKRHITFLKLWSIFPPGEMVYAEDYGQPWLLRVYKTVYEESTSIGPYMEVHCNYTDYDEDGHIGEARHVILIRQKQRFGGENPASITELDAYPAKFVADQDALIARLSTRGRRYLELQGKLIKYYNGLAVYLKEPPDTYFDFKMGGMKGIPGLWLPFTETGRIILDRKTFYEECYSESVRVQTCSPENKIYSPPIGDPVFCGPHAFGYSLSRKEWCMFFVDSIGPVAWKEKAFDSLIMKEDQRLVLEALVTSHAFPTDARNQQQQKGKGLVMLLHGSPGSGKTLSAECAAEATKRALLSTTMGELNKYNWASSFERALKRLLAYATMWEAVVLLDEADVFLEARPEDPSQSAERNALVAVFLRHLEYFSGIVFLTTNRIQVFDPAMKSRIHLALTFEPPDLRMRGLIWEQHLQDVPDADFDVDEVIHTLGRELLNGREISNTINTAQTLARFQKQPLQLQHLQKVLLVRNEFTKSLEKKRAMITSAANSQRMTAPIRTNSILVAGDNPES